MPTRSLSPNGSCPPNTQADVDALIVAWQADGDRDARDAVVQHYAPLARRLARRYRTPYEPFDDLLQVAFVGLLGAIERFDPDRGSNFGSFAIPTILGELKKYFRNTGWAVHVPRRSQEMALGVERAVDEIFARSGRHPGVSELAEYLEVSTEDILAGLDAGTAHYARSLDAPAAPASPAEAGDPDRLIDTVGREDDGYALAEMTASLTGAIARLPYSERRALSLRLHGGRKQSEIAAELGCSQMQVSRLLHRASARLRMSAFPTIATRPG